QRLKSPLTDGKRRHKAGNDDGRGGTARRTVTPEAAGSSPVHPATHESLEAQASGLFRIGTDRTIPSIGTTPEEGKLLDWVDLRGLVTIARTRASPGAADIGADRQGGV